MPGDVRLGIRLEVYPRACGGTHDVAAGRVFHDFKPLLSKVYWRCAAGGVSDGPEPPGRNPRSWPPALLDTTRPGQRVNPSLTGGAIFPLTSGPPASGTAVGLDAVGPGQRSQLWILPHQDGLSPRIRGNPGCRAAAKGAGIGWRKNFGKLRIAEAAMLEEAEERASSGRGR